MGSALVFGALLGALYGALMGLCIAGLLHATTRLNFDLHNNVEASASDLAAQYFSGALVGAVLGAIVLMVISGGLLLFLEGVQQAWRRR